MRFIIVLDGRFFDNLRRRLVSFTASHVWTVLEMRLSEKLFRIFKDKN